MAQQTIRQAINQAFHQEMERDSTVILMGEDIIGGTGSPGEEEAWGGAMGIYKGLYREYGDRLLDTPLSEAAFVGAAIGAATCGMRPVAELMFIDFLGVCFDQIFNQAAKFRYMFGGKAQTPVVIRTMYGAGLSAAAQHSQTLTSVFTHVPGIKVVCPSNPYDAKGLMIEAIRDNDPVIYCEHKKIYDTIGDVPGEMYRIPFGEAEIRRDGDDVTIATYGMMVHRALEAADNLAADGIECEVVDLRTLSPLDTDTVLESVENTGHLVVVDEAPPRCSVAADVAAQVARDGFRDLKAPVGMVTAPHTPVPFSPELEKHFVPSADKIAACVRDTLDD